MISLPTTWIRHAALGAIALSAANPLFGCSNGSPATNAGSGGSAQGGTAASSGGTATSSGGTTTAGGATTTGGATAQGGATTASGGASLGGATQGGVSAGGTAQGGSTAGGTTSGGSAQGGSTATSGGSAQGGSPTNGGGAAQGGASIGGTAQGGATTGSGGTAQGGSALGGAASGGSPAVSLTKDNDALLTYSGLTIVSYGGYLNGESFQEEGVLTHKGYQYYAFWNTNRHVVMARRALPSGAWEKFEFTDYTNTADDAHNTISLGVCAGDGTLHLSFDHHVSDLHYRRSSVGFLNQTAPVWAASSFGAVTKALVGTTAVTQVTYPRFVSEPGGGKLLFGARIGSSGSGDEYLWEYDASKGTWSSLGKYIDGIVNNINAYPHGLSYTRNGSRLHVSWCWRETPDANTNHDLLYAYSDDHGRTWKNNAGADIGTTGSSFMNLSSTGLSVWAIKQNRGLINQEHMAVDSLGRVHVLLSHMPDAQADDANFDSSRTKSQFFDYWRDSNGSWKRVALGLPVVANFRGKLAIAASNNVYAVLPDLRIAAASAASNFASFTLLDSADAGRFFSDPLIDSTRLLTEDKLTVVYPQKSSPNVYALDYTVR
ncbi:MAG: BNR-4 repeat-containing protein [Polyangiaceae bacterium]